MKLLEHAQRCETLNNGHEAFVRHLHSCHEMRIIWSEESTYRSRKALEAATCTWWPSREAPTYKKHREELSKINNVAVIQSRTDNEFEVPAVRTAKQALGPEQKGRELTCKPWIHEKCAWFIQSQTPACTIGSQNIDDMRINACLISVMQIQLTSSNLQNRRAIMMIRTTEKEYSVVNNNNNGDVVKHKD
jgi:hypothetical protein